MADPAAVRLSTTAEVAQAWFALRGAEARLAILRRNLENLRDVSRAVNQQNVDKAQRNNRLGVLGVTRQRNKGGYSASIEAHGRRFYLGTFPTIEQASSAYRSAKAEMHAAA